MNVQTAQGYIRSHGHEAFVTPEGILALSEVTIVPRFGDGYWNCEEGDQWFEEPAVFPIDNNGMVDIGSIRAWLGY